MRPRFVPENAAPPETAFSGVLTGVVGALFLVAVYVVLSSMNLHPPVNAPMASPADTIPVEFECRGNTVFHAGFDELLNRTNAAFARCVGSSLSRAGTCAADIAKNPQKNEYYLAKARLVGCPPGNKPTIAVRLEQIPGAKGESAGEILQPGSQFQRDLANLDPRRQHLIFRVRSDSFAAFHAARLEAKKLGFRAGWEPEDTDTQFSTGCPGGGPVGFRPEILQQ